MTAYEEMEARKMMKAVGPIISVPDVVLAAASRVISHTSKRGELKWRSVVRDQERRTIVMILSYCRALDLVHAVTTYN